MDSDAFRLVMLAVLVAAAAYAVNLPGIALYIALLALAAAAVASGRGVLSSLRGRRRR